MESKIDLIIADKIRPLDLIQDGEWHPRIEFVEKCKVPTVALVKTYLAWTRKNIKPDQMIICELKNRTLGYRLVVRYKKK